MPTTRPSIHPDRKKIPALRGLRRCSPLQVRNRRKIASIPILSIRRYDSGTPGSDSTTAPGETHGNGSSGATETTNAPVADATDPQEVFRILTVETNSDQMNYQIKDAVKLLKKNHPDTKIEVVYFSTEDSDERDILLTQLRTEIIC